MMLGGCARWSLALLGANAGTGGCHDNISFAWCSSDAEGGRQCPWSRLNLHGGW